MNATPRRLVLLGHPVAHSLSPIFQNAALAAAGIALTYEAIDVPPAELASTAGKLREESAAGNVTIPHKESFARLCARRTPLAERVGAVNNFWTEEGALVGDNTDVGGFDAAVARLIGGRPSGLNVALLGAGGAAAAVCAAIEGWPSSQVRIFSRTTQRATELAARFPGIASVASGQMDAVQGAQLVVNATPLGIEGSLMPVAPGSITPGSFVLDLTYRRGRTPWVRACRNRGLRSDDGLPMLIEQGALAWEKWFGVAPDREAMWKAVRG